MLSTAAGGCWRRYCVKVEWWLDLLGYGWLRAACGLWLAGVVVPLVALAIIEQIAVGMCGCFHLFKYRRVLWAVDGGKRVIA